MQTEYTGLVGQVTQAVRTGAKRLGNSVTGALGKVLGLYFIGTIPLNRKELEQYWLAQETEELLEGARDARAEQMRGDIQYAREIREDPTRATI